MHGNPVANFSVTRPSPGTGWINDTNAPTKKPRERVHMAVPMFVHGGDSAVGGEEKKRREEEERPSKTIHACECAVNNIQWHGTMATMWQVVSR